MALPGLSNSMYVARLRHIQSIHESPERRNPDTFVRHFMPIRERLRSAWLGQTELAKLRADPFYYYLVARTRHYDQVVNEAVAAGVQRLLSVGCGSDTRAYRFKELLCSKGVKVMECDQPEGIAAKERLTRRWRGSDHVEHLPIDLNDGAWPALEQWLGDPTSISARTLVMMEGVSPYVSESAFSQFLLLLATRLVTGSLVAYDFKIGGVQDDFGRVGRTQSPFRLPPRNDQVKAFHEAHGIQLEYMELSSELCARLLPDVDESATPRFNEDGLVRLRVARP